MREELSVIKPVILLKALLFDSAARRTKCWHRARFSLLVTCTKYEVDVHFVKEAH